MARLNYTPTKVGSGVGNRPRAVVYTRSWRVDNDQGVLDAIADASAQGCKSNDITQTYEGVYDHDDVTKIHDVTLCYTDDEHIAAAYEAAGKKVIKIAARTEAELANETVKTFKTAGDAKARKEQADAELELALDREQFEKDKAAFEATQKEAAKVDKKPAEKDSAKAA